MNCTARIISIYAADVSGVCSALYEYGGMTVIHDASGCNSTYTTHDEPRWYDTESMVYISALTENDAVMGNDEKLITDLCDAAEKLHPRFIAVCGSPMPAMTGVDFEAIAYDTENRTGIPVIAVDTNGMHSYIKGAGAAFMKLAERFSKPHDRLRGTINLLGVTPLDFSLNGSVESMKKWLADCGFTVNACLGTDTSLDEVERLSQAEVSLVVSSCGMKTAEYLQREYGIPYVVGAPVGERFSRILADSLRAAAESGENSLPCLSERACGGEVAVVGESIISASLACELSLETGRGVRVLESVGESEMSVLAEGDISVDDEDMLQHELKGAKVIIADPLFIPICSADAEFVRLPHEAFSGRCFSKEIPDLINTDVIRKLGLRGKI